VHRREIIVSLRCASTLLTPWLNRKDVSNRGCYPAGMPAKQGRQQLQVARNSKENKLKIKQQQDVSNVRTPTATVTSETDVKRAMAGFQGTSETAMTERYVYQKFIG
jgi:hypothetical protein